MVASVVMVAARRKFPLQMVAEAAMPSAAGDPNQVQNLSEVTCPLARKISNKCMTTLRKLGH
jgi:hypothetical protein